MLESAGCAPRFASKLGCMMWIICALTVGGLAVYAMKYCTEWADGLYKEGATLSTEKIQSFKV